MVGDKQVHKGDVVLVSIPGVNRDTAFGEGPEAFIPERESSRSHLSFGHCLHRCVVSLLSRFALLLAFPALSQRFPDLLLSFHVPAALSIGRAHLCTPFIHSLLFFLFFLLFI